MKNSNFIKNSIIALLPISLALGVVFVGKTDKPTPVNAYDYTTLSKMDINLNDTSSEEIRNYYSDLNSLSASDKKGTNLLKKLKPILSEGQKYFSYDKGKDSIWRLYEIADRDWNKSGPTYGNNGTYDPTTNVIKGYTFGAGRNDESKNPYVHALYIDRNIDNPVKAWGNHEQDGTGINQEHIWAKSHGFDTTPAETTGGARGDPMHLWAGNGYANNIHSNYFYGYVDMDGSGVLDTNTKYPATVGHNYRGTSLTLGSGTVFEPQDSDKGDIARAMFYMVARYNNYAGATKGIDGNEPNLILNDSINNRTGTSGPNDPYNLGVLSDLLEWNKIDPPDEYEIHRNNLLYTNFTHNRNPFIDFPDWADICFGNSTRSADPIHDKINGTTQEKQLTSISVTTQPDKTSYVENEYFDPTGMVVKANYDDGTSLPITDYTWSPNSKLSTSVKQVTISYGGMSANINITVKSSVIHPNSITISPNSFELEIDSSRRLTATVLPTDTTNKGVTWTSSNSDVATVSSSGYVTAVGPGTATIRATTKDSQSSVFGTATVTVPEPIVLDRIELSGSYKTTFYKGDDYSNKGIVVTAYYKQGSVDVDSEDVTEYTEFTGFDSSVVGDCTVTATYNGLTAHYTAHIQEVSTGNTITFNFLNYDFENGETIDSVAFGDYSISFFGPKTAAAYYDNGTAIRVYHENSFTIAGVKKIKEIEFVYGTGDSRGENLYSVDVGTVDSKTGHWTKADGADSVTFTLYNSTSGHRRIKEVKVTYDDSKVAAKTLLSITLDGTPKTQFYKNDVFDSTGLVVNAHYSDFTSKEVAPTSITGYDMSKTGYQKPVVSYTENGTTKTSTYQIRVNALSVVDIELSGEYQTEFVRNETFNHDGLVVTAINNSGSTFDATDKVTVSEPDMSTTGTKEVTVTYKEGVFKTYTILVTSDVSEPVTITKTISEIASEKLWKNSTKYASFELDSVVTISATGGNNSGKYYTDGQSWRLYQNESPTLTISVADGYKLIDVKIDYIPNNNGTLLYKNEMKASESVISTSCQSLVYYVGNTNTATNGQVRVTGIEVTYVVGVPTAMSLESINLSGSYKTSFYVGDAFDSSGLITTAQYNNGLRTVVTPEISGYNMNNPTVQNVTVSYTDNEVTKTTTYSITVNDLVPEEIALSGSYQKTFIEGEEFNYDGLVVKCSYNSGIIRQVYDFTVTGYDKTKIGDQTITVTYIEKGKTLTKTYLIHVNAATPDSLDIITNPTKTSYFVGDTFSGAGIVAECTLNNGTIIDVSDKVTFTGYNMNSAGKQTVTVSYSDGGKTVSDTFSILVNAIELSSIEITSNPTKTNYFAGEELSTTGLVVKATYNNGSYHNVTDLKFSGYDMSKAGDQTVIVSYTEGSITKSDTFDIKVEAVVVTSIEITSNPTKTTYFVGDTFSSQGLKIKANYNNGTSEEVTPTKIDGYDMSKAGDQTVVVHYGSFTKTYNIKVLKVELTGIALSGTYKKTYFVNEQFSSQGLIVTASYNNGTFKEVTPTEITGYDMSKTGDQTVTVKYADDGIEKTAQYQITVNSIELSSIEITSNPTKTTFYVGDNFSSEGLKVTAHYNNGTSSEVAPTSITGYDMSKSGQQTITVTYTQDGISKYDTYTITVNAVNLTSIELSGEYKTTYFVGDAFSSEGLKVTAHYNNGTSKEVSPTSITGYNMNTAGEQIITVTYKEGTVTKTATYKITVKALSPTKLTLSGNYKTEFEFGEEFNYTGLVATVTYDNGSTKTVTPTSVTGFNMQQSGKQTITVSYKENGKTVQNTYEITVKNKIPTLTSLFISGNYKTEFEYGEEFSSEGLVLTAKYSDGSSKKVTPKSISGYDPTKTGYQVITIEYEENGKTIKTAYQVKVKAKPVEPAKQESNIAVIAGVAGGGVIGVGAIITIICVAVKKKH